MASKPKNVNVVTVEGETFTRTGRRYSHVVAFINDDGTAHHVEWASTEALAQKNFDGHTRRWSRSKAGETLAYPWDSEAYRRFADIRMIPVEHQEV
ncbi:hypothetical protein SEA_SETTECANDELA_205 [Mycobacterium phage Settecandela]|nr:hypothetical protein SEA_SETTECANDELA_205 [Mycobacterium phage Settecandela]